MKRLTLQPRLVVLALATAFTPLVFAQANSADKGMYIGISAGEAQSHLHDLHAAQTRLGGGVAANLLHEDDHGNAYKAFVGIPLTTNWAMEAGYFDLGRFGFDAGTSPAGAVSGITDIRGLNLDLVGTWPVSENASLLGRVGAAYAETKGRFSGSGAGAVAHGATNDRDTLYKYGLGVQYALTPALSMRLEGERYRVNDAVGKHADIDLISVGLVYRFGGPMRQAKPMRTRFVPPVYRSPEPMAQAPVVAPAPMPKPMMQVKLQADTLFGFDQDTLQSDGKRALDKLMVELRDVNVQSIDVTGHTDRLGTQAYNAELSIRRAQTVRDYLVQTGGVLASQVTVAGVGSTQPKTPFGECQGVVASQKLITCLRVDRRVEVDVTGAQPAR